MSRRRDTNRDAEVAIGLLANLFKGGGTTARGIGIGACLLLLAALAVFAWKQIQPPAGPTSDPSEHSTAWYEVHFNNPEIPTNKAHYKNGIDTYLVRLISQAKHTVDVADYDFDLETVADALAAAKKRGVQVRMVTDIDTLNNTNDAIQAAFDKLQQAHIPIVHDKDTRRGIMHHKFTVVDGEWVQTGSWNYTTGDTYKLNNHLIILRSKELAANYTAEFDQMFVQQKFGPRKAKGLPHPTLVIGGAKVQNYFAPQDHVSVHLIAAVEQAKHSIYFLAFSFTHDGIGKAIRDKAAAGLTVGGVFETTGSNTEFSEFGKMKEAGLDVYTDGSPYALHHKVLILDERTVVLGSYNFSDNADKSNDENVLIIEDPNLAKAFKEEYDRILALAKNPPPKK